MSVQSVGQLLPTWEKVSTFAVALGDTGILCYAFAMPPLWLCSHSRGRTEKQHEDSDGTCLYQHFQLSQKFKLKGADTTKKGSPLLDGSNEP
jgi:hypothetical protein